VQEKEKELAATYEELNILNQKKTLSEERARIMREVHDGFGAHLVGAMTMLETQDVDYEELSDFLKSSLLDLRIMIDSLDPDTHDVLFALSMLRTRVEPILKNKNITLDWNLTQLPQDLELNPNRTLSLLRVLQELFTNILKHSVANHVRITSAIEDSQQERILKLDFFENGKGFHPELKSGRGIRNICNRIRELNGQIDYCQACDGFRTVISIPGFPRVG
jgi:signal transduction histidine kinase